MEELATFSTPVWVGSLKLDENDRQKWIQQCYEKREETPGRQLSNHGGWQSGAFFYNHEYGVQWTPLMDQLLTQLINIDVFQPLKDRLTHYQGWININQYGNYNGMHVHSCSFISLVYYLQTDPHAGNIVFHHPFKMQMYYNYDNTPFYGKYPLDIEITPEDGMILIFPSYLPHSVNHSRSNNDRISLAFDLSLKPVYEEPISYKTLREMNVIL
jgi:uncharacterized protein (TIGR02466 family)